MLKFVFMEKYKEHETELIKHQEIKRALDPLKKQLSGGYLCPYFEEQTQAEFRPLNPNFYIATVRLVNKRLYLKLSAIF